MPFIGSNYNKYDDNFRQLDSLIVIALCYVIVCARNKMDV
jgi:hypothetical protein